MTIGINLIGVYKKPFNATLTQSITLSSVSNGYLLVSCGDGKGVANVISITVNGVAVPQIFHNDTASNQDVRAWGLASPPSGTFNLVITSSDAFSEPNFSVILLSGVNQSTPFRATIPTAFAGSKSSPRALASSAIAGDLMVDVYGVSAVNPVDPLIVGAGQTQLHQTNFSTSSVFANSYKVAGTDSEAMSWSWAGGQRQDSYAILSFIEAAGGTPPTGTVTIGSITPNSTGASVPFTYSAADQTGFEYRLNGGAAVTGTTSPQVLTGLTPSTSYTIEIRAINASGQGAWSTAANFTTSAAGSPPSGTFTIGTITTTQTTASVPYTYSAADFDSIEYRIDGGTPVTALASPQSLTGLTSATTYGIEFRAVNAFGNGAWSASAPFTTSSVPVGTITSQPLTRNTGVLAGAVSLEFVDLTNPATGALVVRKTGLSTNASSIFTFSDAAAVTGTTYRIDWRESTGEFGSAYVVAS